MNGRTPLLALALGALLVVACRAPGRAAGVPAAGPGASADGAPPPAVPREEAPAPPEPPLALPTPPAASIRELASGARVAVVERRDVPRTALRLVVGSGTSADGERAGAALVTAHAVASTLADRAAALGSRLDVTVGPDAAVFALAVHPEGTEAAIALLADLVRAPQPSPLEVTRARTRVAAAARRAAAEDDDHAASYVIVRDLFDLPTARHPYGTTSPTAEEAVEVTAADVRALLAARYLPSTAILVVAGDVGATAALEAAERTLGRGAPRRSPSLGLTEPFARERDRVTVVDRPGADDAHVFVGLAAPEADDEVGLAATELALEVASARLGLGTTVRLDRFREGPQIARLALRSSAAGSQVDVRRILDELDRLSATSPSEREVAAAQRALVGATARQLASSDGVADALADGMARGQPNDAIARRLRVIADATAPIVSLAARGLAEAPAHVVVIGAGGALGPQLAELAEVKIVDPLAGYARQRSLPQVPR